MSIFKLLKEDLQAAKTQDPAASTLVEVALVYSGVHAIWSHRLAQAIWQRPHLRGLARILSQVSKTLTTRRS
jgi:serine O-acetyltransferase